jgi:hypothetical protein
MRISSFLYLQVSKGPSRDTAAALKHEHRPLSNLASPCTKPGPVSRTPTQLYRNGHRHRPLYASAIAPLETHSRVWDHHGAFGFAAFLNVPQPAAVAVTYSRQSRILAADWHLLVFLRCAYHRERYIREKAERPWGERAEHRVVEVDDGVLHWRQILLRAFRGHCCQGQDFMRNSKEARLVWVAKQYDGVYDTYRWYKRSGARPGTVRITSPNIARFDHKFNPRFPNKTCKNRLYSYCKCKRFRIGLQRGDKVVEARLRSRVNKVTSAAYVAPETACTSKVLNTPRHFNCPCAHPEGSEWQSIDNMSVKPVQSRYTRRWSTVSHTPKA